MESTSTRLSTIFNKLKSTNLVKHKNTSDDAIANFSNILNMAAPVTKDDRVIVSVFRFLYKKNRKSFYKYIHINDMVYTVLLTDGLPIVNVLKLRNIITIKWDSRQNIFTVRKYDGPKICENNEQSSDKMYDEILSELPEKKIISWADSVSDDESE